MNKLILMLSMIFASSFAAAAETNVVLTKDNSLTINDVFTGDSVAPLIKQAKDLDARIPSGDPIYLVISSPGGSIDAGIELIENLSNLHRPVHTITIFSASMGFQTVQGLGERLVLKNGTLMSHRARGGFSGEFPGQLDTRYAYYLKRVTRLDEQAVKRSGGKLTMASYKSLIADEYWCDGADCVASGVADKVITSSCDKSLEGQHTVTIDQFMFMGHSIVLTADYDNCPLNTNALKYNILIDGQPLFKDPSTTTTVKAVTQETLYQSLFGGSSSQSSSGPSLSKDEMAEVQKKIDGIIEKKKSREVVKGY